jgi:hypothetical protein
LVTPLAGTILPGLPGFTGAQTYNTTIGSNYNSIELNYKLNRRLGRDQMIMSPNGGWSRHAERGWLPAVLIGTRVASVNETFTFASSRPDVSTSVYKGAYDIQTQNILWGLNLGSELISRNEHYYWGLRGRVTPAVSFAANQQQAAGVNNTPTPPPPVVPVARGAFSWQQAADQVGPGFLGDLTILGGWQVTPNFAVQVGYDFLWVAGIATATRQFNLDNVRPNSIDGGGVARGALDLRCGSGHVISGNLFTNYANYGLLCGTAGGTLANVVITGNVFARCGSNAVISAGGVEGASCRYLLNTSDGTHLFPAWINDDTGAITNGSIAPVTFNASTPPGAFLRSGTYRAVIDADRTVPGVGARQGLLETRVEAGVPGTKWRSQRYYPAHDGASSDAFYMRNSDRSGAWSHWIRYAGSRSE